MDFDTIDEFEKHIKEAHYGLKIFYNKQEKKIKKY